LTHLVIYLHSCTHLGAWSCLLSRKLLKLLLSIVGFVKTMFHSEISAVRSLHNSQDVIDRLSTSRLTFTGKKYNSIFFYPSYIYTHYI